MISHVFIYTMKRPQINVNMRRYLFQRGIEEALGEEHNAYSALCKYEGSRMFSSCGAGPLKTQDMEYISNMVNSDIYELDTVDGRVVSTKVVRAPLARKKVKI